MSALKTKEAVFLLLQTINKQVQSKMSKEGAEAQKTEDETEPIRENNGHASRETVQPHQQNANDIQSQQSRKAESSKCDSDDGEDDDVCINLLAYWLIAHLKEICRYLKKAKINDGQSEERK